MKKLFAFALVCCTVFLSEALARPGKFVWTLGGQWEFRQQDSTEWWPAIVPSTVHRDLLRAGRIPDPYFGTNESRLGWIDSVAWIYRCRFDASAELLSRRNIELVLDGLDTYATVSLNGVELLTADNMFRQWSVAVKSVLREKKNELLIRFKPAILVARQQAEKTDIVIPGEDRIYARKAAYHFGWDWGARFIGCGVYSPVHLDAWDDFQFEATRFTIERLDSAVAVVNFTTEVQVAVPGRYHLRVAGGKGSESVYEVWSDLNAGKQQLSVSGRIEQPRLWWPNRSGGHPLYPFRITVSDSRGDAVEDSLLVGLRSIRLQQDVDSVGSAFTVVVNDRPLFMKGANIIPPDHFSTMSDDSSWVALVRLANETGMNMLRVWGGGIYPPNAFYNACDSLGILVWQDFMFACSMVPLDDEFRKNVEQEAIGQVRRLRNHPSLALWCGNNESDEGWNNWGWQRQYGYTPEDSMRVKAAYDCLFHDVLPGVVKSNDDRPYHPSSPATGWGRSAAYRVGDVHYWGVWWGHAPFATYEDHYGRFVSEYGFQGLPCMATIREFAGSEVLDASKGALAAHQKHPTGYQTITEYMKARYRDPKDIQSYAHVSQLLQADALVTAIDAHRGAMPLCMGSLYWQLNDTWPVVSWSTVDHTGRKKAAHWAVTEAFSTVRLLPRVDGQRLEVRVVNDSATDLLLRMELTLIDFHGNIRWSEVAAADAKSSAVSRVYSSNLAPVLRFMDTCDAMLRIRLVSHDEVISQRDVFFTSPRNLKLYRPAMSIKVIPGPVGAQYIELRSSVLALGVELSVDGDPSWFEENYFTLLPKENYRIRIVERPGKTFDSTRLRFRSLVDTY